MARRGSQKHISKDLNEKLERNFVIKKSIKVNHKSHAILPLHIDSQVGNLGYLSIGACSMRQKKTSTRIIANSQKSFQDLNFN